MKVKQTRFTLICNPHLARGLNKKRLNTSLTNFGFNNNLVIMTLFLFASSRECALFKIKEKYFSRNQAKFPFNCKMLSWL